MMGYINMKGQFSFSIIIDSLVLENICSNKTVNASAA